MLALLLFLLPQSGEDPAYRDTLTFHYENDKFAGHDSNYTSGFGVTWTSNAIEDRPEDSFLHGIPRAFGFLPTVTDADYEHYVALSFGQEMYTPEDISLPDPPPGDTPYAGVLFLDSMLASRSEDCLHVYTLRLGLVGPSAKGEEVQTAVHRWMGVQEPQGWDTQLSNEPLLNGFYQYHRRLGRRAEPRSVGWDLTGNGGGGLGNYYIGANASLMGRFGFDVPDNYGSSSLIGGSDDLFGLGPARGWRAFAWMSAQASAVGRFLPVDGNTFQDSRSGEREDFLGSLSVGAVVGYERALLSYTYNGVLGRGERSSADGSSDFGSLSLSILF